MYNKIRKRKAICYTTSNTCHGLILNGSNWPIVPGTPVVANFPWLCMHDGPDQLPFEIELSKGILCVHSPNCFSTTLDGDQACFAFTQLTS